MEKETTFVPLIPLSHKPSLTTLLHFEFLMYSTSLKIHIVVGGNSITAPLLESGFQFL